MENILISFDELIVFCFISFSSGFNVLFVISLTRLLFGEFMRIVSLLVTIGLKIFVSNANYSTIFAFYSLIFECLIHYNKNF